MRNSISFLLHVPVVIMFMVVSPWGTPGFAQKNQAVQKIGVYDSRVVTFAWSRSAFFSEHQKKFAQKSDSAQKANDTAKIKEQSIHAMSYQHLLHQMVFGSGSVSAIMELVGDKIPEVAKQAGVSMIVSKYELNYKDPSYEIVDLTDQIAHLFKPAENIDKMAGEIKQAEPVPLEELDIESEMMDMYCQRFGKK